MPPQNRLNQRLLLLPMEKQSSHEQAKAELKKLLDDG